MKLKRFLPSCAKREAGTTLIELMVAIGLSALIALMIVSVALANRTMYQRDVGRTQINQSIRSALDMIGNEVRQAGERLPSTFPAIQLVDNGTTTSDQLIIRRNLLDDSLVGCQNIAASVLITSIALSRSASVGVPCTYPNQRGKMGSWGIYAATLPAAPQAYLFNQSTRAGEFVQLTGSPTTDSGTLIRLNFNGMLPGSAYVAEATSVYIINQWSFGVAGGLLQITENNDAANRKNVVDQITNFQVQLLMQDGTTLTALAATGSWTSIAAVRVTITASETQSGGRVITRSLSSDFFPRNILST